MKPKDLIGKFSIIGSNQDANDNSYNGTLSLTLDENEIINTK
jgi:hypothetical protein